MYAHLAVKIPMWPGRQSANFPPNYSEYIPDGDAGVSATVAYMKRYMKGALLTEIVLWFFLLIPAVI